MKFFTRRQMRSIHKGQLARRERARRMADAEAGLGPVRTSLIQQLCGNLDRIVVVASLRHPDFKPGLVDRLLVLAELERVPAVLALTKLDLSPAEEAERWRRLYASLGYPTVLTSTLQGVGLETLRSLLAEGRSAFCGHSGVGKSSLLAALAPELEAEVGDVSAATQKGRHTTTRVRVQTLGEGRAAAGGDGRHWCWTNSASLKDPGEVAGSAGPEPVGPEAKFGRELLDLPGLKLAPLSCPPEELGRGFPEFAACRCRFRDCLHQDEPGCGVTRAVEEETISTLRYQSYRRILASLAG